MNFKYLLFLFLILNSLFLIPSSAHAEEKLYFIHQDHLGSTSMVTDEQGNVVSKQAYFPYGSTRSRAPNSVPTERQYTSQVSDVPQTNLYYYNARYYSPQIAKFISADTMKDGLNIYAYVANNPLIFTDPTGHQSVYCDARHNGSAMARNPLLALYCIFVDPIVHIDEKGDVELSQTSEDIIDFGVSMVPYAAAYYIFGPAGAEVVDAGMCNIMTGGDPICAFAMVAGPTSYAGNIFDEFTEDSFSRRIGTPFQSNITWALGRLDELQRAIKQKLARETAEEVQENIVVRTIRGKKGLFYMAAQNQADNGRSFSGIFVPDHIRKLMEKDLPKDMQERIEKTLQRYSQRPDPLQTAGHIQDPRVMKKYGSYYYKVGGLRVYFNVDNGYIVISGFELRSRAY